MKVIITVDQAVWERSTFSVDVTDGLKGEALTKALREAVGSYDGYGEADHEQEILDSPVEGVDTQTQAELPNGRVISL